MPTQKIRLDLELDTAEALFELIADVIKSKRVKVRDIPLNKIALAMLGVEIADKIHGHRLIERVSGKPKVESKLTKYLDAADNEMKNRILGIIPEPPIDPRD